MCSLHLANWVCSDRSIFASERTWSNVGIRSSFRGIHLDLCDRGRRRRANGGRIKVFAMSSNEFKMNLNEYMVTLDKPLGIRFALSVDGRVSVHALQKGGNAEKSRIIMVGDTLKKASEKSGGMLIEIKDLNDTQNLIQEKSGTFSLVLERPYSPFPVHLMNEAEFWFNRGRVPVTTWNNSLLASCQQESSNERSGSSGFAIFSPKLLTSQGWRNLDDQEKNRQTNIPFSPLVAILTEDMLQDAEWGHGNFPLDEYAKAWERSKEDLYYNHSLGMQYSKITQQIYVGSCIQSEKDVKTLSSAGITAVLNFQSAIEASNWGIDLNSINESCQKFNILMINCPIRDADPSDLRKKLPFCAGLLLRLLRKNHRVYVTCTTGFDRSPSCVIAYLHWMTDTSLHAAYSFVTGLHPCKPHRPAIASGTWDLIAMVETGTHEQPTHSVIFVWNGFEGEDVCLVGDFTANWKEPIKAIHKGGSRYEAEVRLSIGKYYYKYIINGNWRHSTSSPSERDESGNINNVIVVGDVASVKPSVSGPPTTKDANIVKVIERPLTENERFMLAKAARCIAFLICPIKLHPK